MSFVGIPDEAIEFYEGLEADNSKAYWTANKQVYETSVKAPLAALCEALSPEFGAVHLFRPYRDVRFARDKSLYKTQQGATVGAHYVQISAAGLFLAVGYHRMASDQVSRYREAVDDDRSGPGLAQLTNRLQEQGYEVGGDRLKTRPRGYPDDHPRIDLLRHRSLVGFVEFGAPHWLGSTAALERVAAAWRDLTPLEGWLAAHVGPSREPRR